MNKTALVTGASSGIGYEFSRQLASLEYNIVAVARREQRLRSLLDELPGTGHQAVSADLSSSQGIAAVTKAIQEQRIHLLVNNAGASVLQPFYQSDLKIQRQHLHTNCAAVMELSHSFLQQAQNGDALINLSSIVAFLPTPAQPTYSASKAFIASFSECLWEEQRHRGVYVMGLCPGVTETEFIAQATGGEADGQNLPDSVIQTTEQVVAEALAALQKRKKAIVVTGRANRLMLQMPRFLTRQRLLKVLAVMGDPERAL